MTVLIATTLNDVHAASVKVALDEIGVDNHIWYTSDFPISQTVSVDLDEVAAIRFTEPEGRALSVALLIPISFSGIGVA